MRVVGYVRERSGPDDGDTVFMQSEQVRRWISHNGYTLVAVCQDGRSRRSGELQEGYRALLGIIGSNQVDAVVVPSLDTLSSDKIEQEVMLVDLRARGVLVATTDDADLGQLANPPSDPARLFIRDVLARIDEYREALVDQAGLAKVVELPLRALSNDDMLIEVDDSGAPWQDGPRPAPPARGG